MKLIIVGCGRLGSVLAYRLFKRGHDVVIIDANPSAFNNLPSDFEGRTVEGDAKHRDVLHRAGIENVDAIAVVTDSDSLNLTVGHLAHEVFKVPNVVTRNYSPNNRVLFEIFGLQVVSSTSWGAQRVEELIYHSDIRTVFSAGNGEIEIYELTIPDLWNGKTIEELIPCGDCNVVAITRAGRAFLPNDNTTLQTGDVIDVSATFEGIEDLRNRLIPRKEAK